MIRELENLMEVARGSMDAQRKRKKKPTDLNQSEVPPADQLIHRPSSQVGDPVAPSRMSPWSSAGP